MGEVKNKTINRINQKYISDLTSLINKLYPVIMKRVKSVYEAKSHLSRILLDVVDSGAIFVICRHGAGARGRCSRCMR